MRLLEKQRVTALTAQWALERAETILSNMAQENPGFWAALLGRRWPINHEPLRHDARWALPEIRLAIERLRDEREKALELKGNNENG